MTTIKTATAHRAALELAIHALVLVAKNRASELHNLPDPCDWVGEIVFEAWHAAQGPSCPPGNVTIPGGVTVAAGVYPELDGLPADLREAATAALWCVNSVEGWRHDAKISKEVWKIASDLTAEMRKRFDRLEARWTRCRPTPWRAEGLGKIVGPTEQGEGGKPKGQPGRRKPDTDPQANALIQEARLGEGGKPKQTKKPLEKSNPLHFQIYQRIETAHDAGNKAKSILHLLKADKGFMEQVQAAKLKFNATLVKNALAFFAIRRKRSSSQQSTI